MRSKLLSFGKTQMLSIYTVYNQVFVKARIFKSFDGDVNTAKAA